MMPVTQVATTCLELENHGGLDELQSTENYNGKLGGLNGSHNDNKVETGRE